MTVGELLKALENLPPETQVIVSKDSEGNEFSPLWCVTSNSIYIPDTLWSGDVYDTNWSAEDAGLEEEQWAAIKRNHPCCCVLVPTC